MLARVQRVEIGDAIDAEDHRLAVDNELLVSVLQRGLDDPGITAAGRSFETKIVTNKSLVSGGEEQIDRLAKGERRGRRKRPAAAGRLTAA